jgi:hypothetical protein
LIIVVRGIDISKAPFTNVVHMSPCSYNDIDFYYTISSISGIEPIGISGAIRGGRFSNSSTVALAGDVVDFSLGSAGVFDTILAFTKTGD